MVFVPEGQCDRSLARSAWESPPQKSRPVGYGLILAGVRTSIRGLYCNDEVSDAKTEEIYVFRKRSITSDSSSNINTERAFDEEDLRD
jgi:hypothetical protein